jgi:hypothetical protein
MIPVQTKEHLIYFMQSGMMRLSKYDLRFVQNLQLIATQNNNLTTNQVSLFDKLVDKYKRQLHKHGLTDDKLSELKWDSAIVTSDPKFTEAYVSISNDTITFRSPFSKKFIENFRRKEFNTFEWYKDKRFYQSPYSTQSLKYLIEVANEHYPVVNYCPVTTELLNNVDRYNAKYWNPTLVKHNDLYMVAAITTNLADAISNITLSSDPEVVSTLVTYGIDIDDSVVGNDPLLKFAASHNPELDLVDIDNVITYLKAIKCDCVTIVGRSVQYSRTLTEKLKNAGLCVDDGKSGVILEERLKDKVNPVAISLTSQFMISCPPQYRKIIKMKNSTPVTVK